MYKIEQSNYFLKKAKKLLKSNEKMILLVADTIEDLCKNPKNPSLFSHKVDTPKFGLCFSTRVSGDIRIIWRYKKETGAIEILELLDIGGHSGGGKVYK